ncbi:MAG TPA: hypothetical protein PKY77_12605 [Phycisphaerae bacterium]|nr:hypothetical protein [Phycisphaerae bacterium]HRY69169.1 hypothetical protein [Phycisphaerae bacterium]HSA26130.1 hypothetical protein [Phycisphaerae bacterium]
MGNRGAGSTEARAKLPSHTSKVALTHTARGCDPGTPAPSRPGHAGRSDTGQSSDPPISPAKAGCEPAGSVAAVKVNQISAAIQVTHFDSRVMPPTQAAMTVSQPASTLLASQTHTIPEDNHPDQTTPPTPPQPPVFIGRSPHQP